MLSIAVRLGDDDNIPVGETDVRVNACQGGLIACPKVSLVSLVWRVCHHISVK